MEGDSPGTAGTVFATPPRISVGLTPLPPSAALDAYERQASGLLDAWNAGDADALGFVRSRHPHFLREDVPWVQRRMTDEEARRHPFALADARLTVARGYDFRDWDALKEWVGQVSTPDSPVALFESAVEAVVDGDAPALASLVGDRPDLVRARSTRVTHFDPPIHRSTLLHYVAANGVEGHRQRTPANAVDVAKTLLGAGAEVDALADLYGGRCTTMSLLVSSSHPAQAGVQVALVHTLVDAGAAVDETGEGAWTSPLLTALVFGYLPAAEALVERGARTDSLSILAGLGRVDEAGAALPAAGAAERHRALALAAALGHVEVVRLLLEAGEDPSRYNPPNTHSHSTPLHQAVWAGHDAVARLLVERGASLEMRDTIYSGTPLDWAVHGKRTAIADYLRGFHGQR
jgi:ankyrin repeat protein